MSRVGKMICLVLALALFALMALGSESTSSEGTPAKPSPTPQKAKPTPAATNYVAHGQKTGEIVEFGHYEQDDNEANGPEPIQWIVLEKTEDKTLLVSLYILDYQRFNGTGTDAPKATWETSFVRNWLNDTFFKTAFTSDEQRLIKSSEVITTEEKNMNNEEEDVVTIDKVFLLSYKEAWRYFKSSNNRQACPSKYVKAAGIRTADNGMSAWWLRSETDDPLKKGTNTYKRVVNTDGDYKNAPRVNEREGVRPAIWVDNSVLENSD